MINKKSTTSVISGKIEWRHAILVLGSCICAESQKSVRRSHIAAPDVFVECGAAVLIVIATNYFKNVFQSGVKKRPEFRESSRAFIGLCTKAFLQTTRTAGATIAVSLSPSTTANE